MRQRAYIMSSKLQKDTYLFKQKDHLWTNQRERMTSDSYNLIVLIWYLVLSVCCWVLHLILVLYTPSRIFPENVDGTRGELHIHNNIKLKKFLILKISNSFASVIISQLVVQECHLHSCRIFQYPTTFATWCIAPAFVMFHGSGSYFQPLSQMFEIQRYQRYYHFQKNVWHFWINLCILMY